MTRMWIALLVALPILAACSEGNPTEPGVSPLAHVTATATFAASPIRPAGGRCDTDITILPPVVGDPANLVRLHIDFACQLKHLGRTTATAEQIVIFTSPTTAIASNTATYTAANGDQLFATWSGTSTSIGPAITFSGLEIYAGGTGRFVGASGSAWVSGTASFITNTGKFTSTGTLSY